MILCVFIWGLTVQILYFTADAIVVTDEILQLGDEAFVTTFHLMSIYKYLKLD